MVSSIYQVDLETYRHQPLCNLIEWFCNYADIFKQSKISILDIIKNTELILLLKKRRFPRKVRKKVRKSIIHF